MAFLQTISLINLVDKITDGIGNGKFVIGIFIDLRKAFDTIDLEILFKKLDYYGIRRVALNWLKKLCHKTICLS